MKIKIVGIDSLAILAETEHERQWLELVTNGFNAPRLAVRYSFPNHEPKDLNNPVVTIEPEITE